MAKYERLQPNECLTRFQPKSVGDEVGVHAAEKGDLAV